MKDLTNQTAIVTGAGSGIGQAIALALAEARANVIICGRRWGPLQQTVQSITALGGLAKAVPADVSSEADVKQVVNAAVDGFGGVDILINNAGVGGGGPIHSHDVEIWDQVMAINLRGPFLFARHVLPLMREKKQGHIINISSESGLEYYPGNGSYGVAKHALNALGEFIQRENQEQNIRVDTICPGMVITEMTEKRPGLNHDNCLTGADIADLTMWLLTRRANIKIGRPVLIQTMANPWS